ncbi:MAG: hypothetical protein ACXACT_17110 [Candidatus Thorarchaeota archaeon]|jgi:hypothetical protein
MEDDIVETCPLHDEVMGNIRDRIQENGSKISDAFREINSMKKWTAGLLVAIVLLLATQLLVAWQSEIKIQDLARAISNEVARQLK